MTDFNSTHKSLELINFIVQQVIDECTIYDTVNVKGLVYNVKNGTAVSKEWQPVCLRKKMT